MTSKEALERLYLGLYSQNEMSNYYDLVLKNLERLEILERNSDKVIKDSVALMNKNLELQQRLETLEKENKELRKDNIIKYEYLIEAKNNQIEKLKKALDILKGKLELCESIYSQVFNSNEYYILCNKTLTKEQFELLKEVLE